MGKLRMTPEEFGEIINSSNKAGAPIVVRNLFTEHNPSWADMLEHLNLEYNNREDAEHNGPRARGVVDTAINNLLIRGKFYYMTIISQKSREILSTVKEPLDFLNAAKFNDGAEEWGPNMSFITLIREPEFDTQVHADPGPTVYWQVQGESSWQFYENYLDTCVHCKRGGDPLSKVTLRPGDVIFVPEGASHTVISEKARAAIVFRTRSEVNPMPIKSTNGLINIKIIDGL